MNLVFMMFIGEIPVEIGNLIALETFAIQNMSLIIGVIPNSIFNISSLKEITLYNNTLSGHIPSNIGECSNRILM